MKIQKKWFLLGSAIAVGSISIFYILANSNHDVSKTLPMAVVGSPAPKAILSAEELIKRRELVQQMIQNGEFRPPPGNVGTISSAASPFGQFTRGSGDDASKNPDANSATQPRVPQIISMNLGTPGKQNAVAVATRDNLFQPVPVQASVGTQSSPIEFESPPGIGSPKGGQ